MLAPWIPSGVNCETGRRPRAISFYTIPLMATVTRTYLVDDLDGSEEDVISVSFSLDKKDYEIDLSAANEARLRTNGPSSSMRPLHFTPGGRVVRSSAIKAAPVGKEQSRAIREWARSNGYEFSARGRISAAIQKAFDETQ